MLIYAIRHGQTDWNVSERLQGAQDIPLNATGRAQAASNGRHLAQVLGEQAPRFDFVASPLTRTRQTMELVRAALGLVPTDFRTDDRLIELSFGTWEGRTLDEVAETEPERVREREQDKWAFLPPGERAESYAMLARRVDGWLRSVERDTVCICHGGVLRSLFYLVAGVPGDEAAIVDTPQDRILKIENGRLDWL